MSVDSGLVNWVVEALVPLGRVTSRAMMGGATLYLDGTVFAIVAGDALWLKADRETDARWDAEGCGRFTYEAGGKTGTMNYRRAPDATYDDADALTEWAKLAVEAGARVPPRKPRRAIVVTSART